MNATRSLKAALLLAMLPASVVASEGEAAVNSGRANAVKFHFPSIAEMRPAMPENVAAAVSSANRLSLTWVASHATVPTRTIDRYDVYRNGVKVAQTTGTAITLDYDPASLAYEYFRVRAVDSRGIASPQSAEVLAPNNAVDNPLALALEVKVAMGTARKFGFPGWRDSGTYFKKAKYTEDYVHQWDGYIIKAAIDMSVDLPTGQFSIVPTGTYTYWFMDDRHQSAIQLSPDDPFTVIGPVENPRYRTWRLEINHRCEGQEYFQPTANPNAPSNTLRSVSQYTDQNSFEYMRWELSDEFTDDELHAKAVGWYNRAFTAAASGGWNTAVRVKDGAEETFRYNSDRFAFRQNSSAEEEELGGGTYRFKVTTLGTNRIRWAEVTSLDGARSGTAMILEETVTVTDAAGAYTSTHVLPPPEVPGTTSIQTLTFEPRVTPTATSPIAARVVRPLMQQVVLPEQPAELMLDVGLGACTMAQISSWSVSVLSGPGMVRLVAVDPEIEAEYGLEVALETGTEVTLGSNLIERGDWTGFAGFGGPKLIAIGVTPGPLVLEFATQTAFDDVPSKRQIALQVLPPFGLLTDVNHDGQLTLPSPGDGSGDIATSERPFRFWLNDDQDTGEVKVGDLDDVSQPPSAAGLNTGNASDARVNGVRDLIDFFPVYLQMKGLCAAFPPASGYSFRLRHDESSLGVVFTSLNRAQAFDYLRGSITGLQIGYGPALAQAAGDATVTPLTASGVDLGVVAPEFLRRIQESDGGVMLVEVANATSAPLVFEVRKGADLVATAELALKADPVETMFSYHNLRGLAHGKAIAPDNLGPNYGVPVPSDAPNDPFIGAPNRRNVVFVHGYNVNGNEARGSAAEVFKRLYWSGSKAKYYALLWRGDDGQGEGLAPSGATPDYHRNVGHAWQQGLLLRDFLKCFDSDTAVMAHSLGNVVTQVALTYERDPANAARLRPASRPTNAKNYFAIDAALPLEAVDGADIPTGDKAKMRHPDWAEFDERLWPTDWHSRFPSTDARNTLTWINVFSGLDFGTNFYSSGEEILANPEDGEIPVLDALRFSGRHAWVVQEKLKGGSARFTHPAEGVAIQFLRSRNGGWVTNKAWYVPIVPTPRNEPTTRQRLPQEAQEAGVPSAALPAKPFFKPFQATESGGYYPDYQGARLLAPVGDANAEDEARKLVTVAKCLGEAIPALSFAVGRNESIRFKGQGMNGNFDLNTFEFKNGWPSSRGPSPDDQNWKHSDCLNVAYTFNFPLYDKISADGGLK